MNNKLKAVVIGASGFGRFHVRELLAAGVDLLGVLGSSKQSAEKTAENIKASYDVDIHAYANFDDIEWTDLDIVTIASPEQTHFDYLSKLSVFDLYVFCEKPLLWTDSKSGYSLSMMLSQIEGMEGRIGLNLNNSYFLKAALAKFKEPVKRFKFEFTTHGNKKGLDIAVDLLPHALGMVQELLLGKELNISLMDIVSIEVGEQRFACELLINGMQCMFLFNQDIHQTKLLSFTLNSTIFTRIQDFSEEENQTFLKSDAGIWPVIDPLRSSFQDFINSLNFNKEPSFGFKHAKNNTEMLYKIVEACDG